MWLYSNAQSPDGKVTQSSPTSAQLPAEPPCTVHVLRCFPPSVRAVIQRSQRFLTIFGQAGVNFVAGSTLITENPVNPSIMVLRQNRRRDFLS